jgi:hypothetical protein
MSARVGGPAGEPVNRCGRYPGFKLLSDVQRGAFPDLKPGRSQLVIAQPL